MAFGIECGGMVPAPLSIGGTEGVFPLFVTGADPDIGGTDGQIVDMTAESEDYAPADIGSGTFVIVIETDAPIEVQLANGTDFTITQAQATAHLGQWYPALLKKVYKTGTTGTFSVGQ
jgi:hypothetical protein